MSTSAQYPIQRWDVVQLDATSNTQFPMIYITPDTAFVEQARLTGYVVELEIQGTGKRYDGKKVRGTVDRSANIPSCRPNYYAKTGQFVITLELVWDGYPAKGNLGSIKLLNQSFLPVGEVPMPPEIPKSKPPPSKTNTTTKPKNNFGTLGLVLLVSFIAIIIMALMYSAYRNK